MRLSQLANEAIKPDPAICGLTADSRAVESGYLFAALPGVNVDGQDYIPQAEERGAAAILARPGVASALPTIIDDNPRKRLAEMAARFFPGRPETIAGVTGTNGKTSTALFTAQLWRMLGKSGASMGTLGVQAENFTRILGFTTPEPVALHKTLQEMTAAGVTHLAMEVSSHGLAQHRADGVHFEIAAFANITQDHLDYHDSFDAYFGAKARLFTELLGDDGVAVVNMDGEGADDIVRRAAKAGRRVITVGGGGEDIRLLSSTPHALGLEIQFETEGKTYQVNLPLIGAFQAENALLAAGIAVASGEEAGKVAPLLEKLNGAPGRMELAAEVSGASAYVDYAHTPDAVATALKAIRPHASGRVIAIIGAGGDRDQTKRPLMGGAASENADIVIVTDDNPRTEDPASIRAAVLEGCKGAMEIGDRGQAIAEGIAMLEAGDVLLIAGKGHETGQVVGRETLPFNDAEEAKAAALNRMKELGR